MIPKLFDNNIFLFLYLSIIRQKSNKRRECEVMLSIGELYFKSGEYQQCVAISQQILKLFPQMLAQQYSHAHSKAVTIPPIGATSGKTLPTPPPIRNSNNLNNNNNNNNDPNQNSTNKTEKSNTGQNTATSTSIAPAWIEIYAICLIGKCAFVAGILLFRYFLPLSLTIYLSILPYHSLGEFSKSIDHFQRALKKAEECNNKYWQGVALENLFEAFNGKAKKKSSYLLSFYRYFLFSISFSFPFSLLFLFHCLMCSSW